MDYSFGREPTISQLEPFEHCDPTSGLQTNNDPILSECRSIKLSTTRSGLFISVVFFLLQVSIVSPALSTGLMDCDTGDPASWKAKAELQAKLEAEGWTKIEKIKVDDGCYEAYATTPDGEKVEAYFNPITFEKLLVARRGLTLFKKRILFEKGVTD